LLDGGSDHGARTMTAAAIEAAPHKAAPTT
jgi:hypothetical protein